MFYIKEENNIPVEKLYTAAEVSQELINTHNLIAIVIPPKLFFDYGFYEAELDIILSEELKNISSEYISINNNKIENLKKDGNKYIVSIKGELNETYINSQWQYIISLRNEKLLLSDWIMNSGIVTDNTKDNYAAYRKYLRAITDLFQYPFEVIWINAPSISYVDTYSEDDKDLSNKFITKIMDYVPKESDKNSWISFLNDWKNTNFSKSFILVNALLASHNYSLKNIL